MLKLEPMQVIITISLFKLYIWLEDIYIYIYIYIYILALNNQTRVDMPQNQSSNQLIQKISEWTRRRLLGVNKVVTWSE